MEAKEIIADAVRESIKELGSEPVSVDLEHPADSNHGDYSTNIAMTQDSNPKEFAERLVEALSQKQIPHVEKIEVAGPGFINFYLDRDFFAESLMVVLKEGGDYGKSKNLKGQKIMIEYTDPNVMKPFHIGHLMSNAIGESFSRLLEWNGAEVKRANYFSDVGLGIAKAVWGMKDLSGEIPKDSASLVQKTDFLGKAYVHGVAKHDEDSVVAKEVGEINKQIYKKEKGEILDLYNKGREWSIARFEEIYDQLGSKFDFLYPESEVAEEGASVVEKGMEKGVFEKSDGAVVFKGEKYGLHTRVFINSEGIPTYEAKDLGLNKIKSEQYPFDKSIIITASEQDAYFEVVLKAMELVLPEVAEKTKHISHGMMRFAEGKMSSRTGNVITSESLISTLSEAVQERMDSKEGEIAEEIAIGAIKYSVLKQTPGKNIAFDMEKSLSFEGDSGPYLQYTCVRARSVLEKAKSQKVKSGTKDIMEEATAVERMLYRFPEVVERAASEYSPQYLVTYLTELSSAFNSFYANEKIVDKEDKYSPFKLSLTESVAQILENGLFLLGTRVPVKM